MPLAEEVLAGNPRALAKAASAIEARTEAGLALSRQLFNHTGNAMLIGLTGPPGAGKSTLVNCLIRQLRQAGKTVGVVAVDPSSPCSLGALLGDRVRMLEHHADSGVFIRSMAARGHFGGVASTTLDLALLLDAAGRQVVLIETVGVGQDEIDIVHLAQVTVLVLSPGAGDSIQALKAGILEVADVIVINKADLPGADRLRDEIVDSQGLLPGAPQTPVCKVSSASGEGVPALFDCIQEVAIRKTLVDSAGVWAHRLRQKLRDELLSGFATLNIEEHARMVSGKLEDPWSAIAALKAQSREQAASGD